MGDKSLRIWQCDPHQFGAGKRHYIDEDDPSKTYCGSKLSAYPGKPITTGEVTCKKCADAPQRRADAKERAEYWQREREAREVQEEKARADREQFYRGYIQGPKWKAIALLVKQRAGFVCEGCGKAPATAAHHLSYEHLGNEFLWELKAVCDPCHTRFHFGDQGSQG